MIKILKYCFWLALTACLISCGGSLTKEQQEKAKRAIEEGQIKRITPAQLTEVALSAGKTIAEEIYKKDPFLNDASFLDSISSANKVLIFALRPEMKGLSTEETGIAEAYQAQADISGMADNVQRLLGDSLLYTFPVGKERPDGTSAFSHAIAIKMAVKQIVISIKE
jgi:hypothetical protein